MDKGARFYRCDFQVHSPRDYDWKGARPQTEDERKEYAREFIAACRLKGLEAVAITDHHDVCFFPYIKAAAEEEVGADGGPVSERCRIVVFPGMELTLSIPCQALIIFDADMPPDSLVSMHTVLNVTQADPSEPTHVQTARLDFRSFSDLAEMLDRLDHFRGRYILLPNVSEGGSSTMLRSGFAKEYRSMPCVGGYLDGPISQIGRGNRSILGGQNREYGEKRLGLFPTSDNRKRDFSDLGKHTAWVKWATPKAEAIRQACLACDTRISHEPPTIPSMVVTRIEVSDSKFLGTLEIYFNPQYSCLIGGRGTGKSTILEYLRWALCDQPPGHPEEDDHASYQEKRASLIEKTLLPLEGVVTVHFTRNSVPHVVRRSSQTKDVSLKIGHDDFKTCTESDVRDLLPVQAYSQKQLSAVGVRTDELMRFIRTSIKTQLDRFAGELQEHKTVVRDHFSSLVALRRMQRDLQRDELELASLTQQVEALRGELAGLDGEEQVALSTHDLYLQEEQHIETVARKLDSFREMARDFRKSLSEALPAPQQDGESPNREVLARVRSALADAVAAAAARLDEAAGIFGETGEALGPYRTRLAEWMGAFDAHNQLYERAKLRASAQGEKLWQIDRADGRIKELRTAVGGKKEAIAAFGDSETGFAQARAHWADLHKARASVMQGKCAELTDLSTQRIRAKMRQGAGVDKVKGRLLALIQGTRIQKKKVEDLCEHVSKSHDPYASWAEVLDELECLIDYSSGEAVEPKVRNTPILTGQGFTAGEVDKLAPKLTPEEWIELVMTELEDVPVFEYHQGSGQYIQFSDASAGQQATALLRVLLNQSGPPLLIDQPEEDLDNQVILDVVQEIWKAKQHRQIIFTSHNPNIVVNGDADLVICCDYRTAGDHSGGRVKCCGAIDVEEIKHEITVVMEGGRDAFRLRKEKYGF